MQFSDLGVSGDGTAGAVGDGAFYDGSESACQVGEKGELTVFGGGAFGIFSDMTRRGLQFWWGYGNARPNLRLLFHICLGYLPGMVTCLVSRHVAPAPCR